VACRGSREVVLTLLVISTFHRIDPGFAKPIANGDPGYYYTDGKKA
jgi:hypothetical protein